MIDIYKIPERELQKSVHRALSDPAKIFSTEGGERLQVLSPGRLNVHSGPDFRDAALFFRGSVVVGDIEFHRKTSDWIAHGHTSDPAYSDVVLHAALEIDRDVPGNFHVLKLPEEQIREYLSEKAELKSGSTASELADLQHFALIRLLRRSSEASKILDRSDLESAFLEMVNDFIDRYSSRRKRPVYDDERLRKIIEHSRKSPAFDFLKSIEAGAKPPVFDEMAKILKTKIYDEGAHLRREIIMNCAMPLAVAMAGESIRANLFLWYWSAPSLSRYGKLTRRFPDIPQDYLWQQQGMLEYLREYGSKQAVSDFMRDYGFARALSFYKYGREALADAIDTGEED